MKTAEKTAETKPVQLTKESLMLRLKETGYGKGEAKMVINDVFNLMAEALVNGETLTIRGFGTLGVKMHKGHPVHNANTGEVQVMPDYKVIYFKPGLVLKDAVRSGDVGKLSGLLREDTEDTENEAKK